MSRPPAFDAKVVAYMPGLYRTAIRLAPASNKEADELVQDTVEAALRRWTAYRTGTNMHTWLTFMMRHVRARYRRAGAIETVHDMAPDDAPGHPSTPATQEHALDIKKALAGLSERGRKLVVMAAQEFTLEEIGAATGISKQRAKQLLDVERERIVGLAARADTRRALAWGGGQDLTFDVQHHI